MLNSTGYYQTRSVTTKKQSGVSSTRRTIGGAGGAAAAAGGSPGHPGVVAAVAPTSTGRKPIPIRRRFKSFSRPTAVSRPPNYASPGIGAGLGLGPGPIPVPAPSRARARLPIPLQAPESESESESKAEPEPEPVMEIKAASIPVSIPILELSPEPVPALIAAPAPKLHDFLIVPRAVTASSSPDFMDAASTWSDTRLDVLATVLHEIDARIPGSRLEDMQKVFAVGRHLASGVSGVVYKACLNISSARGVCKKFSFPKIDPFHLHKVPLVLKNMVEQVERDRPRAPYAPYSCVSRTGECTGYANMHREALMGRFLNMLVTKQVTPHLPVIYKCFSSKFMANEPLPSWVRPDVAPAITEIFTNPRSASSLRHRADPTVKRYVDALLAEHYPKYKVGDSCCAIATEMCHMTFDRFVKTLVESCRERADITRLLNVAFIQLAHGIMCAQKYFNFRHNDFHNQNAMMTYITAGEYRYAVDGVQYDVPNYGMCWKLIDFGFSSSTKLFGCHDNGIMLTCSHALSVADQYGLSPAAHSAEMYDLLRFMHVSKGDAREEIDNAPAGDVEARARWQLVLDYFKEKIQEAAAASQRSIVKSIMEGAARTWKLRTLDVPISIVTSKVARGDRAGQAAKEAARKNFARLDSSNNHTGVAQDFFKTIARDFVNPSPARDGFEQHTFNADQPLFRAGEMLDAFEHAFYKVNDKGELVPRMASAAI